MAESDTEEAWDPVDNIEPHILVKLDPDFVKYWTGVMNRGSASGNVTIGQVRANPTKLFAPPCARDTEGYLRTVNKEVTSEDGAKIPVRVYYPDESIHGPGPYPVHLNFHGGGFVLGDLSSESTLCMSMSKGAGVAVVDVNYRHCPKTVWGKCFQDGWAALNWARDEAASLRFRPDSVSVGGISAGGHISAVLQHRARDAGIPLKIMMASVPATNDGLAYKHYTDAPFASFHEFSNGPILSWKMFKWFGSQTMPEDRQAEVRSMWPDWWLAPIRAPNFRGLCPSYIRTAECDPLRDEGEAYGMKLVAGGNDVKMKRYLGSPHTFMFLVERREDGQYDAMKQKTQYDIDSIAALKEAHCT